MNSLVLFYASLLGGMPMESGTTYQVEVKLVDVTPSGDRQVLTTPVLTVNAGKSVRVECSADPGPESEAAEFRLVRDEDELASDVNVDEANRTAAWRLRVGSLDNGKINLELSVRRPEVERLISRGVLTQSRLFNIVQQIEPNQVQRIYLSYDETGRPISWLDVRIRGSVPSTPAPDAVPANENAVYPFYYTPF
jgi:hypothetical protein